MKIIVLDPQPSDPTWAVLDDTLTLEVTADQAWELNTGTTTVADILRDQKSS